ncbi:monovalent cation/H(+) antiporter subunit G [Alkalicella caledoniensis]|uniref:Monovalent cation/H(+) antiporter subunit G n=1 Tax=Alkalicella caledoniensis TaxID=2731377 RepID=A0A7G9W4L3_ALKCA|nr:monovalent cation/H(+) antiporter subunit G [Alkalicella caledoniensis]QNO13625.1 monovalent cation/H(+) antiporter subunit G [Alkalicella caledoniensis]
MLNIIVTILLFFSVFFFAVGTIGLIRLPDTYTRMHATTKGDTLGAGLGLLALALYNIDKPFVAAKLMIIIVFIWITNPTAAHVIAKAQYKKDFIEKTNRGQGE